MNAHTHLLSVDLGAGSRVQRAAGAALLIATVAAPPAAFAGPIVFDALVTTINGSGYAEPIAFAGHTLGSTEHSPGTHFVTLISGPSTLEGWQHQALFDFGQYDLGFFITGHAEIELSSFFDAGMPTGITSATATDALGAPIGTLSFDPSGIQWQLDVPSLLEHGPAVVIHWNLIPAPGTMALLGLAGPALLRRRR